jgi:heme-degrading monooxygenase HmoA
MFVVIFEVQPKAGRFNDYLELAKYLKPKLEAVDGFIDNERYESTRTKGRILSLSTWRDEKSVIRWRAQGEHHGVQEKGRFDIFEDYHLRVGEVTDDSNPPPGMTVIEQHFDETENKTSKAASIIELMPPQEQEIKQEIEQTPGQIAAGLGLDKAGGAVDRELFKSIYTPGKLVLLVSWDGADAALAWQPKAVSGFGGMRHRRVRVIRDYGMRDRGEAPQFYPDVGKDRSVAAE